MIAFANPTQLMAAYTARLVGQGSEKTETAPDGARCQTNVVAHQDLQVFHRLAQADNGCGL